jgi:cohesin loading factor subunit SCC2
MIALQTQICRYVPQIVIYMLASTRDKTSSKLRARGVHGLEQLIRKDPKVMSESQIKNMVGLLSDTSPLVRESVLSLVSTCFEQDLSLQRYFLPSIFRLATDSSNGPKQKAIKLLKDIYAGPSAREEKLQIATQLFMSSQDEDDAVSRLSRSVLEDIWFAGASNYTRSVESHPKLDPALRASLIIDITDSVHTRPSHLAAFEKFFVYALSSEARRPDRNLRVCKDLVEDMFNKIASPMTTSDNEVQERTMTALSVFAKIVPTLFTVDQIQPLEQNIKECATIHDLLVLRPTVIIFRYVFATLHSVQQSFAEDTRAKLMRIVAKLAIFASAGIPNSRNTLVDVAQCIWTITPMVSQGPLKLCAMITSIISHLQLFIDCTLEQAIENGNKIKSYLILLGTFGQVSDFSQYAGIFRDRMGRQILNSLTEQHLTDDRVEASWSADSHVALIFLDTVQSFTLQQWDMSIREQALKCVGVICQQSPQLFTSLVVARIFKLAFLSHDNSHLQRIALQEISDYFAFAEKRSESGSQVAVGQGAIAGNARLEASLVGTYNDSATLYIAQQFLANFVDFALGNDDDVAILATNIIASVSRQGLVHPKECGAVLVALGTSPNDGIAHTAATEHKRIHEKQESYLGKEYVRAIRIAFIYHRDILNDPHGMHEATHSPKLVRLFDSLVMGRKVVLKNFIRNVCSLVNFDPAKLDAGGVQPEDVLFVRFCLENIALLEFPHLEGIAICLNALESMVFKATGPAIALVIETEMPTEMPIHFVAIESAPAHDLIRQQLTVSTDELAQPAVDDRRLRQITTACMILQIVWETCGFIRRCYNLNMFHGRILQKEHVKPAQRNKFISGKQLWERLTPIMNGLTSRKNMLKTCHDFAKLMKNDQKANIGGEGFDNSQRAGYDIPREGSNDLEAYIGVVGDDDSKRADYDTPRESNDATKVNDRMIVRGVKRKSGSPQNKMPKKARVAQVKFGRFKASDGGYDLDSEVA